MFVVTRGQPELVLNGDRRRDPVVVSLGPGDCLTPLHLKHSGKAISGLRAPAAGAVEVLNLRPEDFESWIGSAPGDLEKLEEDARLRAAAWYSSTRFSKEGPQP